MTCCWAAATTGSAIRAHTSAIRASMCRSSPSSPITDTISGTSRARLASEVQSLTSRASAASSGCVQAG
jgi:hypothetical protein